MSVQRMIIDPALLAKQGLETDAIDNEHLTSGANWKQRGGAPMEALQNAGTPLNLTFSEPSLSHNLEDQINFRRFLAEYCFEKLDCQSISFVKQASVHLYSECHYNGIVVDFGAELTQISPVTEGYTSQNSSSFFKVTGKRVDEYMFKHLYSRFTLDHDKVAPKLDCISLYKIKNDLKETVFSPYSL